MEKNNQEKPFNFWKFIGLMFLGLLVLTSIVVGVPYLLMK
ncbi:tRNA uridine 5-carboxymethylaminomethyl modification protein [Caminibacter sp.]